MFEEVMPGGDSWSPISHSPSSARAKNFNDTQREFADTARKFIVNDVLTRVDALEEKAVEGGKPLALVLLKRAADIGMCGVDIPEEYGGLGMTRPPPPLSPRPSPARRALPSPWARTPASAPCRSCSLETRHRSELGFRSSLPPRS